MHVLNLARRFSLGDWGGTETVVLETSKALIAHGHTAQVFCTLATASQRKEEICGVPIRRFPYFYPYIGLSEDAKRSLDKKGGSPFSFSLMRAMSKVEDLDVIHIHAGNRIGGIGRHVARKRRIPYFVSLHGGVFNVPPEERASWSLPTKGAIDVGKPLGLWVGSRRLMNDAAAVICVDKNECAAAQKELPEIRVLHIPNGVDPLRFQTGNGAAFRERHKIPRDAVVLLTVARIDVQKNQKMAVRILPALLKNEPKLHLLVVGSPANANYLAELHELAARLSMEAHVTVVPGVDGTGPDIADAYHSADIFILPSQHEPFGIVVLEAWAAGLPVVASRVGGIPAFVEDGSDGLLFASDCDAEAVEAIDALLKDGELRRRLAANGRKKAVDQFSWFNIAVQLEKLYEEALRENPLRK